MRLAPFGRAAPGDGIRSKTACADAAQPWPATSVEDGSQSSRCAAVALAAFTQTALGAARPN